MTGWIVSAAGYANFATLTAENSYQAYRALLVARNVGYSFPGYDECTFEQLHILYGAGPFRHVTHDDEEECPF